MLRLQRHSEFVKVLQKRQKVSSRHLVVHYRLRLPSDRADGANSEVTSTESRLGLAVSKTTGNAVVRNKVKRRFRVLARKFEHLLPPGSDIVMRALPHASTVEFAELEGEVQSCFSRIARNVGER